MELRRLEFKDIFDLWELQKRYKAEIGEDEPDEGGRIALADAIAHHKILFFGAFDGAKLVGCCSVSVVFSTFNYLPGGVFEDFYILPDYRHKGIARSLVNFAYRESGVSSMTVGCADCDLPTYRALGFTIPLGNLLAFEETASV